MHLKDILQSLKEGVNIGNQVDDDKVERWWDQNIRKYNRKFDDIIDGIDFDDDEDSDRFDDELSDAAGELADVVKADAHKAFPEYDEDDLWDSLRSLCKDYIRNERD